MNRITTIAIDHLETATRIIRNPAANCLSVILVALPLLSHSFQLTGV